MPDPSEETASTPTSPAPEDATAAPAAAPAPARFVPAKPGVRDLALTALSLAGLAALMSVKGHTRFGVPLGIALSVAATLGLLGLLGDSPLDLRGDEAAAPRDDAGAPTPWWKREGTWVVLFSAALYLPFAGAYGLWDPWETHYSEVAREILSRDDWITTWWGQEGWFMSKPVLIFWMSALGMGVGNLFGLRVEADAGPQWQEWCIRVPISLLAMGALYGLYRAVAGAFGKRAGLLVALVLATMPHWFFLAHQAMTDMPFVAPLVLAVAMLMRAVTVAPDELAAARRVTVLGRSFRVSLWHLAVGAILVCAVPQIVYLVTRPMVVSCPPDARLAQCQEMLAQNRLGSFQFPVETYFYGSAGNSADTLANSVPGSPAWERLLNVVPFFPSAVQGLVWILLGGAAMWLLRRERKSQALYFVMVFFWCAISTMGKGPAGLAIPVGVAALFLVTSTEWRLLRNIRLGTGLLVFAVVGLPWYVAILGRLGNEFFDRFVVHDIINRTVVGVHGDTGTFRYFVWQLGYAMFPWTGLVPSALVAWRQIITEDATRAQRHIASIGVLWFLTAFVLFSAMITKFHHYIFPAVPGAAVMVGLLLDRMLGAHSLRRARSGVGSLAALAGAGLALVVGIANFFGSARGVIPRAADGELPPGSPALAWALTIVGVALAGLSWWLARGDAPPAAARARDAEPGAVGDAEPVAVSAGGAAALAGPDAGLAQRVVGMFTQADPPSQPAAARAAAETERYNPVSYGAMAVGAAVVLTFVARDLGYHGSSRPPGYQRLLQLFTYQYERQWPTASYDFHPIMIGFGAVAVAAAVFMVAHRYRAHAVRGMVVVAALFAAWSLDVYMVDISDHWSQRGIFERYYRLRRPRPAGEERFGEDARYTHDPIAAYQLNWKGENFYTGGRAAMLDCGDLPFCSNHARTWVPAHRGQRIFAVTEHSHAPGFMAHVRNAGGEARTVTDTYFNNKFVLIEATVGSGRRPAGDR